MGRTTISENQRLRSDETQNFSQHYISNRHLKFSPKFWMQLNVIAPARIKFKCHLNFGENFKC